MQTRKLWISLTAVLVVSFGVLLYVGADIYHVAPPVPKRVLTSEGKTLFTGQDIHDGQNVWQSMGGQQVGTIWGHGSYVAPDWSADWLHREAEWLLNYWAKQGYGVTAYAQLDTEKQAALQARLCKELRANSYNPQSGDLLVSPVVALAVAAVGEHYDHLFAGDPSLNKHATRQRLSLAENFWFGHQGYEYVDLGRFWQIFLFIGLLLWLFLMGRGLWPALKQRHEKRSLLGLFFLSSCAISLFYGAGLMWGRQTNLALAEYWRWWVVHLWVEGFFEVFATVVIAFLLTRMSLIRSSTATAAVLFSTTIFLAGGVLGTFHHLYFAGTPTGVLALGAVFSALEVVPLVLVGFEAYENLTLTRARPWVAAYRWPIICFVAVGFWNLVGAGLFGFLINPPIALYYMQGLNTTLVHGHTALFGVYGMLGIGLTLFCLKGLAARRVWRTRSLAFAFWSINIGLALMVLLSDLPRGLLQTWASIDDGMWYARSAEFTHTGLMETLRWLRVIGDTVFTIGVFALAWFVLGLKLGWSVGEERDELLEGPVAPSPAGAPASA